MASIDTEDWHSQRFLHYSAIQQGRVVSAVPCGDRARAYAVVLWCCDVQARAADLLSESLMIWSRVNGSWEIIAARMTQALHTAETKDWWAEWTLRLPDMITCETCNNPNNDDDLYQWSTQGNIAALYTVGVAAAERSPMDFYIAKNAWAQLIAIANAVQIYMPNTAQQARIAAAVVLMLLLPLSFSFC